MSDEALLDHIRRGSEPHFGELYNRYFQRIYTFAYVRVRNHADAEEIAQETFTAVFRSIGAFGGRSTLLSWIYGIAKNTANNHLRRAKPHDARIDDLDESVIATTDAFESSRPDEEFELHAYARTVAARRRLVSIAALGSLLAVALLLAALAGPSHPEAEADLEAVRSIWEPDGPRPPVRRELLPLPQ